MIPYELRYKLMDWPRLAWLARCTAGGGVIDVLHGAGVETGAEWYCEAVWPGEYADGDFDRTDLVFGSGARLRYDGVKFVSSGTTVDRLHSLKVGDHVWVSNSLPCLLAVVDARVNPAYPHYIEDLRSIIHGLQRYKRTLRTSLGPVRLTYFHNLHWNGQDLVEEQKDCPERDFSTFASYKGFLEDTLRDLAENLAAPQRGHAYEMLGTISSGYDSPAVTALARPYGLRQVIAIDRHWRGDLDSGLEIAEILGVDAEPVASDSWYLDPAAAIPFLAVDGNGGDVSFTGAERLLEGRVLLTGYQSGHVWGKRITQPGDEQITRSDQSGLSLSEYRLQVGFIHCPIPFMGVRQVADINALGRSREMAPYDVGGDYNKPIPRRIVEEAGVPRGRFATAKIGVSVRLSAPEVFWRSGLTSGYLRWLRAHKTLWLRSGRIPPHPISQAIRPLQRTSRSLARVLRKRGGRLVRKLGLVRRLAFFGGREYVYKFLFPWALEMAKQRYPFRPMARGDGAAGTDAAVQQVGGRQR